MTHTVLSRRGVVSYDILDHIRWNIKDGVGAVDDVACMVTGSSSLDVHRLLSPFWSEFPDIYKKTFRFVFGRGKPVLAAKADTLVELAYLLPIGLSGIWRRKGAELISNCLGSNPNVVDKLVIRHDKCNKFGNNSVRITRHSIFFQSNIIYIGHYREFDISGTVKIGYSKDILNRVNKSDYAGRMSIGFLIALPTETLMKTTERVIINFIKSSDIGAHGKEYICTKKLSRLFHIEDAYSVEKYVRLVTSLIVSAINDPAVQITRAIQKDKEPDFIPLGFPNLVQFEILSANHDFTSEFMFLSNYENILNDLRSNLIRENSVSFPQKRRNITELDVRQKEIELERERIELEMMRLRFQEERSRREKVY